MRLSSEAQVRRIPASSRSRRRNRRTTMPSPAARAAIRASSGSSPREQRAGRGRHGRQWSSPPGNLYASLLLIDPCEPRSRTATRLRGGARAAMRRWRRSRESARRAWRSNGRTICCSTAPRRPGLLLEGHRRRRGAALAIIIGFGINVVCRADGHALSGTQPCNDKASD